MAEQIGKATFVLEADAKKFNRDLDNAKKKAGGLKGALGGVAKVAGGFLAANVISGGMSKLTGFMSDSIEKAKEQMAVEAQLEAVLKSTGGAAGVTADEVKKLATALQKTTNFGDEVTIAAENMLLTFTGIGKDVFPRATKSALDMATALGTSPVDAAKQLGMALNDPAAGISRLTRSGIVFTEQQKEQIKTMVEAGDKAGAQALMLNELEMEFGGSAEAAVKADGGMQQAENAMGDLQEKIGKKLIPVMVVWKKVQLAILDFMVNKFAPFIKKIADVYLPPLKEAFTAISEAVGPVIKELAPLFKTLFKNKAVMIAVGGVIGVLLVAAFIALGIAAASAAIGVLLALAPFIAIAAAVALVVAGIYLLVTHFDDIKKVVNNVFNAVKGQVQGIIDWVSGLEEIFNDVKAAVVDTFATIKKSVKRALTWLKAHWPLILAIMTGPIGLIVLAIITFKDDIINAFTSTWERVKGIFNDAIDVVTGVVKGFISTILGALTTFKDTIVGIFTTIKDTVVSLVTSLGDTVTTVFNSNIAFWTGLFTGAKDLIISIFTTLKDTVIGLATGLASTVTGAISEIVTAVSTKMEEIITFLIGLPERVYTLAGDIGRAIFNGIVDAIGNLPGAILDKIPGGSLVKGAAKKVLGFAGLQAGIWDVPGTGRKDQFPSLLAPGEMVLPAGLAEALRRGLSGGGEASSKSVNVTINNPQPAAAEDSMQRKLLLLSQLGVV